ncbi:MAG: DUF4313 domain-containing protein [Lachnospiraceae bacterium]|nr:DUF4313 domain-containing protein [Lachnospiraceae bacterium]
MTIKTTFGVYHDGYLRVSRYLADNSLFVAAWSHDEGALANLTVCLGDTSLSENESYVDVNNYPEVLEVVADLGLGIPTGEYRQSGYVTYPVVAFDMEKLLHGETVLARCFEERG